MEETITLEDLPRFMAEIRARARNLLKKQPVSLQTNELVDSAIRRLFHTASGEAREATWENREHFLATLYLVMHSTIIDHARRRQAQQRGVRQTLRLEDLHWSELPRAVEEEPWQVIYLHEVLTQLEQQRPEWAAIVKHRLLGLTYAEIAEVRGVSESTVKRALTQAQHWCDKEILRRVNEAEGPFTEGGPTS